MFGTPQKQNILKANWKAVENIKESVMKEQKVEK